MKYKWMVTWYDQNSTKSSDVVTTDVGTEEAARDAAFTLHNGNPPAPFCLIKRI